jgi:hypothetical protein
MQNAQEKRYRTAAVDRHGDPLDILCAYFDRGPAE